MKPQISLGLLSSKGTFKIRLTKSPTPGGTIMNEMRRTKVLGHRGWSAEYPENTCFAFEKALRLGSDGIEFDVQLTKDGIPVIIHDVMVDRTTDGTGRVSELTAAALRKFNAAARKQTSREIGFQPIPTLGEVLKAAYAVHADALCNIEIKVHDGDGKEVVDATLRCLREHPYARNILFSSFHHGCLAYLRNRDSQARIGLLYEQTPTDAWHVAKHIQASSIHLNYRVATPNVMNDCHDRGLQVCVWTVDAPSDIDRFMAQGTDVLITNSPERAVRKKIQIEP
jgi:glycerophosphoryl diester phosphodiesterase